tara:strand:- start:250 stop:630 length:381 start_codon:yes stop_codon:yes gene_type:complete
MDYAVVKTGGKQYRVSPGDIIDIEKLPGESGSIIELPNVLLLSQAGKVTIGKPEIDGVKVVGEVEEQKKGKKLVVFKFKSKTRQGTKTGHRQQLTSLRIKEIVTGKEKAAPKKRTSKAKQESSDGS